MSGEGGEWDDDGPVGNHPIMLSVSWEHRVCSLSEMESQKIPLPLSFKPKQIGILVESEKTPCLVFNPFIAVCG